MGTKVVVDVNEMVREKALPGRKEERKVQVDWVKSEWRRELPRRRLAPVSSFVSIYLLLTAGINH